jgi:hypothetical protein
VLRSWSYGFYGMAVGAAVGFATFLVVRRFPPFRRKWRPGIHGLVCSVAGASAGAFFGASLAAELSKDDFLEMLERQRQAHAETRQLLDEERFREKQRVEDALSIVLDSSDEEMGDSELTHAQIDRPPPRRPQRRRRDDAESHRA